jgi:hypothetical protein
MVDEPTESFKFLPNVPIIVQVVNRFPWDAHPILKKAATAIALSCELGLFHFAFAQLDRCTDFAICKFLNVTPQEAHLITSGMMFGRKARLLADLIARSDHPQKASLLGSFNAVRGNNKRDIIAHGHLISDENDTSITFLERSVSGEFRAKKHTFTMLEFITYVIAFYGQFQAFHDALGVTDKELEDFSNAALSLNRKS